MKTEILFSFLALLISGCGYPRPIVNVQPVQPAAEEKLVAASTAPARIIAPALTAVASPVLALAQPAVQAAQAIKPAAVTVQPTTVAVQPAAVTPAEATKHNAVVVAEHAYKYGVWCIIAGALMCGIPALPTGPGYGVVGAGVLLLLAGIFLPAYYWYLGVGILIGCVGWVVEHTTTSNTWAAVYAWLKSKLPTKQN